MPWTGALGDALAEGRRLYSICRCQRSACAPHCSSAHLRSQLYGMFVGPHRSDTPHPVQVAGHAVTFLRCRALACPALLSLYVATGSLRGHQDTRTPLQAALIANAVNLTLDIVLIFGLGLGVAGVRASAGSC